MIPLRDILPARRQPIVTKIIVGLNVAVFVLSLLEPGVVLSFAAYASELTGVEPPARGLLERRPEPPPIDVPAWVRAGTHMWLHGGLAHLFFNMLFLWIFGDNVEDRLGHGRFVVLYLLGGFAALAAQVGMAPGSDIPMVGASGAVASVLGAYLLFYPDARVVVLVPIGFLPLFLLWPAKVVLGLWVGLQVVGGLMSLNARGLEGGVAWWAHIGGFALGLALAGPLAVRGDEPRRHSELLQRRDPFTGEPFTDWRGYREGQRRAGGSNPWRWGR